MAERVALNLRWCFGFNKDSNDGTLIDLTSEGRQAIFYAVGHTGIIFDYEVRRQRLLQGHTNTIMCAAASDDKKWLVTADSGEKDTMIVVWNSRTAVPVRTIFDAHPGGVLCVDMTHDAVYIATVGAGPNQSLSIWEWTVNNDAPLHTEPITSKDIQHCVRFSRDDPKELVTNGPSRTIFWSWSEETLKYYSPAISSKEFLTPVGRFTKSVFLPNSTQAVTGAVTACSHHSHPLISMHTIPPDSITAEDFRQHPSAANGR
jgi:cilia- and flagella-associated protein 251